MAVKNMTTKVNTKEKETELEDLISQYRKEKAEIQDLVDKEYQEVIKTNSYDAKFMRNYWLLNNIVKPSEMQMVEDEWKIIGKHSLENTSVEYFMEYAKALNTKIINVLEKEYEVRKLSYARIGKLCLLFEIVNPNFNWTEENMGILELQLPKVKRVIKLFQKNYYKIVNDKNFSESDFIEILKKLEKEGE
ncbi:MAG: hypothetical protein V8R81_03985 [Clostridia bacterium]